MTIFLKQNCSPMGNENMFYNYYRPFLSNIAIDILENILWGIFH